MYSAIALVRAESLPVSSRSRAWRAEGCAVLRFVVRVRRRVCVSWRVCVWGVRVCRVCVRIVWREVCWGLAVGAGGGGLQSG